MSVLGHWSFDPFLVLVAAAAVAHEVGLTRVNARSTPSHSRRRRRRSLFFYGGLLVVLVAVDSPLNYWSYRYFYVHMIEHILLMFFAPMLLVKGAPWVPFAFSVPVGPRRRIGRAIALGRRTAPLRQAWRWLSAPWTAIIAFNTLMVLWHVPGPFDLAQRTSLVYVWVMHGSFVGAGLLFWLQLIPSRPFHRRATTTWQMGAIISSNIVMFILAMALSIFTSTSWYSVYDHVPGVTLSPFADQQIGAAILWVCGDFWALPSLNSVVRRAIDEEGSLSQVLDAILERRRGPVTAVAPAAANGAASVPAGNSVPFDALHQEGDER